MQLLILVYSGQQVSENQAHSELQLARPAEARG